MSWDYIAWISTGCVNPPMPPWQQNGITKREQTKRNTIRYITATILRQDEYTCTGTSHEDHKTCVSDVTKRDQGIPTIQKMNISPAPERCLMIPKIPNRMICIIAMLKYFLCLSNLCLLSGIKMLKRPGRMKLNRCTFTCWHVNRK